MDGVFKKGRLLLLKSSDLSYYNLALQKVNSTDSAFFRVDAGLKERLIFKNNIERKIINDDLEYIKKHPELDVERIPINIRNSIISEEQTNKTKFIVTHNLLMLKKKITDSKKLIKKKEKKKKIMIKITKVINKLVFSTVKQ